VRRHFRCYFKVLTALLAEYQRAIAAARLYDELKLHHGAVVRWDGSPNRIFMEFYSHVDGNFGRAVSDRTAAMEQTPRGMRD
jgi:hypothetical protein